MSDRVRYAVGNTAGRDFINWPTILRSEIPTIIGALSPDDINAGWPAEISLEQIMALVWRVSKWKLSGGAAVSISYFDPGISQTILASGTVTIPDTDVFQTFEGAAITREADLLKKVFDPIYQALVNDGIGALASIMSDWSITGTDQIGMGSPSPFSESDITAAGVIGILGGFVLFDDPNFSPPFNGDLDIFNGSTRITANIAFDKNPTSTPVGTSPVALQAPGNLSIDPGITAAFDVPLQLSWRLVGEATGSSVSGSGSADLTLEAVEFWPYETSDHLPVWDSADGGQLNDPFS